MRGMRRVGSRPVWRVRGDLFTRDGSFQILTDGQLVSGDGLPVLGGGGPIYLPVELSHDQIRIGTDGLISAAGNQFGTLDIVAFEDNQLLVQEGPTRFRANPAVAETESTARLQQGSLEMSNASAVSEMIAMMIGMRHFEAAQQSLRSISESVRQFTTLDM